jgi:Domain of unknown function (DU1801)
MATAKTQPTDASIDAYIASRATESQAADCRTLMALLAKLTGEQARMWGPSIVGFGSYRYTYESGRSGESCATGFAIRGKDLVIYLVAESDDQAALLGRLGKHKMGKACLYVKRLADLDLAVLEQLVANSLQALRLRYPQA